MLYFFMVLRHNKREEGFIMADQVTSPENQTEAVEATEEQLQVESAPQSATPAVVSAEGASEEPQAADQVDETEEVEPQEPEVPFDWQASEYIQHHKGLMWYLGLSVVVVALLILAVVMKLWLSIGVFLAMAAAIVVYAKKPPRTLSYHLDDKGVTIEGKVYEYSAFRSFSVVSEEEWHSIDLEPTQRFMPRLSVLFGDDDFDEIVAHLVRHLPRDDREPDMVERLSRYLRF
jgi:hypothetical protein